MKSNKPAIEIALSLSLIVTACGLPHRDPADFAAIKILAFNDFHGQLQSPGDFPRTSASPSPTDIPVGGVDWMAGYIAQSKNQNPNTIVVSAGDLIGASPLVSALFHDEGTIEAMNRLGLDFNAVGNHEFDDGQLELKRMQTGGCHPSGINTCRGEDVGTPVPFEGAQFQFLAANVLETSSGGTLFPSHAIKTIDGVRIGFIGLTLKETPTVVSPGGIHGLTFLNEAATANALIPTLRAQGIEAIVILIHQGGNVTELPNASAINQCADQLNGSPIKTIVAELDDAIDLVISGHTHQAYNCKIANKRGRLIPVTSANTKGRLLTDIDLRVNRASGDVTNITATNIVVDRNNPAIVPDAELKALVDLYQAIALPIANRIIGGISSDITRIENEAGESALGDVMADAHLAATQNGEFGPSVIAFTNPGAIRADLSHASSDAGEGEGKVTYGEAFTVQPFGDNLITMTLTGAQIHTLLEQQFMGCTQAYPPNAPPEGQPANRILQVSLGFSYQWQEKGTPCDNVDPASITLNGIQIDPAARYRITVNNFLADGGDQFYLLQQGSDRLGSSVDMDALESYFLTIPIVKPGAQDRIKRLP